jgi:hypothetical protein
MLFWLSRDLSVLLDAVADPREPGSVLKLYAASFALNIALFHVKTFKRSSEEAARQGVQFGQVCPFFLGTRVMWNRFPVYSCFIPENKAVQNFRTTERKPR